MIIDILLFIICIELFPWKDSKKALHNWREQVRLIEEHKINERIRHETTRS